MEDLVKERKELIEELGVYFENSEKLSPLSARIFAMLVLAGDDGLAFEKFVVGLEASKSSISTNLQLLQTAGIVTYNTKSGDRKRYFTIAPDYILVRLDKKLDMWEKEKNLHLKVLSFKEKRLRKEHAYSEDAWEIQFPKNYARLIDDLIKNLTQLKANIGKTIDTERP